jgi:mannose-6-phosphate isomerase-like protein (cupin superfamily)
MSQVHHVIDVALLLQRPPAEAPETGLWPLHGGASTAWSLLRVAGGARWQGEAEGSERSFVVLEGAATFHVDGWRRTLASGHLLVVAAGQPVRVDNESADAMSALVTASGGQDNGTQG